MSELNEQLKHWGAWSRDNGRWRQTCCSLERNFIFDKSRYNRHEPNPGETQSDDAILLRNRTDFRYDIKIAERVESIVRKLFKENKITEKERAILIIAYVFAPHLSDEQVARKLKMNSRSYLTVRAAACSRLKGACNA